jgi:hypothetical protein
VNPSATSLLIICLFCLSHTVFPFAPVSRLPALPLTMAELPGKAKQVPKQQRPSRLRNEVFPESPDDERDRKKPVTEGPSSDAIVPETQPNHEGLYIREDHNPDSEPNYDNLPTSPGAAEFLERTAVTKKADVPTWAPFAWKTPTKEPLAHNNDSPSTGQTAFAFSRLQASKAPGNTFPEGEATSVASIRHPESKTSSVHQFDVQASQGELSCHFMSTRLICE